MIIVNIHHTKFFLKYLPSSSMISSGSCFISGSRNTILYGTLVSFSLNSKVDDDDEVDEYGWMNLQWSETASLPA
jgi:hypothetical protein